MERHQRLADREELSGIRARSGLLAQRHERKDAEDAHGDEGTLDDASRDEAQGEYLVHPLGNRIEHDGAADVGDDEDQLQQRAQGRAVVGGTTTDDVARVVQQRPVEKQNWGDRSDIRDQEQYARNSCDRLRIDLDSFPLVRSTTGDLRYSDSGISPSTTSMMPPAEPRSQLLRTPSMRSSQNPPSTHSG